MKSRTLTLTQFLLGVLLLGCSGSTEPDETITVQIDEQFKGDSLYVVATPGKGDPSLYRYEWTVDSVKQPASSNYLAIGVSSFGPFSIRVDLFRAAPDQQKADSLNPIATALKRISFSPVSFIYEDMKHFTRAVLGVSGVVVEKDLLTPSPPGAVFIDSGSWNDADKDFSIRYSTYTTNDTDPFSHSSSSRVRQSKVSFRGKSVSFYTSFSNSSSISSPNNSRSNSESGTSSCDSPVCVINAPDSMVFEMRGPILKTLCKLESNYSTFGSGPDWNLFSHINWDKSISPKAYVLLRR